LSKNKRQYQKEHAALPVCLNLVKLYALPEPPA